MTGPNRRKKGCTLCRDRHHKCDRLLPSCSRCLAASAECVVETTIKFRHSKAFRVSRDQKWVKTAKSHRFLDESPYLETLYALENESAPPAGGRLATPDSIQRGENEPLQHDCDGVTWSPSESILSTSGQDQLAAWIDPCSPPGPKQPRPLSLVPEGSIISRRTRNVSRDGVAIPMMTEREVLLMKYYQDYMCHWFDLCDTSHNHFKLTVPARAISCPTLLNAIFAVSSRHLSIAGQFDQYASDRYHQECLNHLSTVPFDEDALRKDDLLAATILLRTLEEIDVPLVGADYQGHLLGIQIFMNASSPSTPASGLRQASFWIGLRQEIYMAFVSQRPVKTKLDHRFIDRSFGESDDDTWAKRILVHCAEVENFCFGEGEMDVESWRRLREYDEKWLDGRPLSFLPLSYRAAEPERGECFPEIWYMNHAVVIGIVHRIIARVLLMCYNPIMPRIGPGHRLASQQREDEIKNQIRELCATALSNPQTIPAMFTACMGVTMCGDRFTEKEEQDALLSVLVKTEVDHAWPTGAAQIHLKRAWGWEVDVEANDDR